jgi:hypothetical protein
MKDGSGGAGDAQYDVDKMVVKIFISYASSDRALAKQIKESLKDFQWIEPLIIEDSERNEPGTPLRTKVANYIEDSNLMIPILTKAALKEQWPNQEIGYAFALIRDTGRFIPLVEDRDSLKGFVTKDLDLPLMIDPANPEEGLKSLKGHLEENRARLEKLEKMKVIGELTTDQIRIEALIKSQLSKIKSMFACKVIITQHFHERYIPAFVHWATQRIRQVGTDNWANPENFTPTQLSKSTLKQAILLSVTDVVNNQN